jgi:DNA-directed RNA polymerase specialized sigma24 family protein
VPDAALGVAGISAVSAENSQQGASADERSVRAPDPLIDLQQRAHAGVPGALDELLRALKPRLQSTVRKWLGSSADAEDCVQDALVALTRALPRFRGDSSVTHFATKITIRLARRARLRSNRGANGERACPIRSQRSARALRQPCSRRWRSRARSHSTLR